MARARPRELLSLPVPRIEAGADANLVMFNCNSEFGDLQVRAIVGGRQLTRADHP